MKKPRARLLLLSLVLVAGAGWWFFPRERSPGETATGKRKAIRPGEPAARTGDDGGRKPAPLPGTEEFKAYAREKCAKWLATRGRDAAGLLAMWDLTGDQALLEEAAEKFPNDPGVCSAMLAHLINKGDARPWVERLLAAEPRNPAGCYWKAQWLSKTGKPAEALEAMRAAVTLEGPVESHTRSRMATAREALLASGGSVKEASMASMLPLWNTGTAFSGGMISLLSKELEAAKTAGDTDRLRDLAALGVSIAEQQGTASGRTFMEDLVRLSTFQSVLSALDPAMELKGGKTATARPGEVTAITGGMEDLRSLLKTMESHVDPGMGNLTASQASGYVDRYLLHGAAPAMRWLNSQELPPVTPAPKP